MSIFDRMFGKGRDEAAARKAELRGDLVRAVHLWAEADRPDEAARVLLLRGDAETEVRPRLLHYTQAAALAPEGHAIHRLAKRKRAQLVVAMASGGVVSAALREDVLEAARDLEALGEAVRAAEAFALAGDAENQARALASAGEIDRLETVLTESARRERAERRRRDVHAELDLLVASGRRREALATAEAFAAEQPDDAVVKERARTLRARAARGPVVAIELAGERVDLVVGDAIVVGRTEGAIVVPSSAVSRRHLRVARDASGAITVEDLGSRNGTELRGMRIAGKLPVGDGLTLALGGEVPLTLTPSPTLEGALAIDVGGRRLVAPLGPARIGVDAWRLEDDDGWITLVTEAGPPAYAGDVEWVPRASLLVGDGLARRRGEDAVLRILDGG